MHVNNDNDDDNAGVRRQSRLGLRSEETRKKRRNVIKKLNDNIVDIHLALRVVAKKLLYSTSLEDPSFEPPKQTHITQDAVLFVNRGR